MLNSLFKVVNRVFPASVAHAHCDIPCGIYDPVSAKIAAQTVQKMVMRIQALEEGDSHAAYANTLARYIAVKEQHADLCKKELDILWHDYFNPTHLEKYPDIHTKFWQANKLAARNKQNVDMDAAKELVGAVDEIATIFWATKNVTYKDEVADVRFGS
ncbi:MAG: superoxide dismutase, Ni [Dehalococcoidia bacterium]|nr:superoxide dismutase, Ni [Dehalococcoidia bacterium]